jgi:Tol biopolymer transport system component
MGGDPRPAIAALIVLLGVPLAACNPTTPTNGTPSPATTSPSSSVPRAFEDTSPRFAPDGETLVFVREQSDDSDLFVLDLADGTARRIVDVSDHDLDPVYSPDGQLLLFESSPNGFAQLHLASADGDDVRPISEVLDGWATFPAWSPSGDRVVYSCGHPIYEESDICILTVSGEYLGRLEPPSTSHELEPAWAQDGSTIAFSSDRTGDRDLYLFDLASHDTERLTDGGFDDGDPSWSPDGSAIVFTRGGGGSTRICLVASTGGAVECIVDGIQPSWSPDGQTLVFYRATSEGTRIFIANVDGSDVVRLT